MTHQTTAAGYSQAASLNVPQAPLAFSGISASQQDFLVALYVGAFSRAPEFEGLSFWAGSLASQLSAGNSSEAALQTIGRAMYQAGAQNGEGGTQLGNHDYVSFAYQNSLGREPDAEGYRFWVEALDNGRIERGDFLSTFLGSALDNQAGDSQFLGARISVAEYLAQEHVSGPGAAGLNGDVLKNTLTAVTDEQSARDAITDIIGRYGEAPPSVTPPAQPGGGVAHFMATIGVAETWDMNFEGYRQFEIFNFTPAEDRLYFGNIVATEIIYMGEPRGYQDMITNYFTGVAGQAALNRETSELIIDVNGDGKYSPAEDLLITLPGVYQLEDYNLIS